MSRELYKTAAEIDDDVSVITMLTIVNFRTDMTFMIYSLILYYILYLLNFFRKIKIKVTKQTDADSRVIFHCNLYL